MGIATGQWRTSIGSWHARYKFQLTGANTNILSISSVFYALLLAVLLVVGGVEMNPGPNTQSCCELCGVDLGTMKERELALQQRDEAVLGMLQQREAACDAREQALEQREASLQSREAAVRKREKISGTPAVNQEPGGVQVMRTLLEKVTVSKTGLLQWAVLNSYSSIARFLIEEAKVDVDAKDSSGRSLLFLAVENGLLAAVELLLPLSTEEIVKDNTGKLAFHSAVSKGHIDVVKCLISDNRSLVRTRNSDGCSALHLAAEKGHLNIVKFLYHETRADVEVKHKYGSSPLLFAARCGHLNIVKFLVQEAHSDVKLKQQDGWTALHFAATHGHLNIVKFLVQEAHSDVNLKKNDGCTALHLAAADGHLDIIKFLVLEAHSDVEVKSNLGCTALHLAASDSHLSVAEFLVQEAHADVGSKTSDGRTALQLSTSTAMKNLLSRRS